jgi:EmrB/QacA subfamily drug resistance transporter
VVLSVAFAAFMVNVDNYIVVIALPTITASFAIDTGTASWISISYLLAMVATMLVMGRVGDRIGVRTVFIAGYVIFTFASLLCGISPGINWLIMSRVLQGLGGCMLYVGGFAVIPRYLPPDRHGWAFGITSTAAGLGMIVGAPLGGIITQYLSWHWAFLLNLPVGIVAGLCTARVIQPEKRASRGKESAAGKFDVFGSLLSLIGIIALLLGISGGPERGWGSMSTLARFATALVFLSCFIVRQGRLKDPLVNLSLFRIKNFVRGIAASFSVFLFFAGSDFLLPFYLSQTKGLSSSWTGLVLTTYSLVYLGIAPFAGRVSDRMNPGSISTLGMVSASAAFLFFGLTLHRSSMGPVILFLAWLALSLGFFFSPNNKLVVDSIPEEDRGVGIALFWTINHFGILLGICLFETIHSAVLPGHRISGGLQMRQAGPSAEILFHGFRNAFIAGGIIGLITVVISSLVVRRKDRNDRAVHPDYSQQYLLSPGHPVLHRSGGEGDRFWRQ